MPLQGKPFMRRETPSGLRPEDGFKCKAAQEVFKTYDESNERTLLCNSEVWSCSLTKKPGLTYQEAVSSERQARDRLLSFPTALVHPLLHLVTLARRNHFNEVCEDVYNFAEKRYFPGEFVHVTGHYGTKVLCEILEVQSTRWCRNSLASSKTVANGKGKRLPDRDAINRDESTPRLHINRSPALFRYVVKKVEAGNSSPPKQFFVKAKQIKRTKRLSKNILKLWLKERCEKHGGVIRLKPESFDKTLSQFFPDIQEHRMSEKVEKAELASYMFNEEEPRAEGSMSVKVEMERQKDKLASYLFGEEEPRAEGRMSEKVETERLRAEIASYLFGEEEGLSRGDKRSMQTKAFNSKAHV